MKNSFEDLYSISTNLKVVSSEDSKTSCGPEAIKTRRRQGEAEYKGHGRARALIKQNKKKKILAVRSHRTQSTLSRLVSATVTIFLLLVPVFVCPLSP